MARHDWKTPFLNALREGHTVSFAAKLAGVNRQFAYKHRSRSERFREAWDQALAEGLDNLLEMVRARAFDAKDRASAHMLMFLVRVRLQSLRLPESEDHMDIEIV
jgi:hypothetical protein